MGEETWEQWIDRNWESIETKKTRYEVLFVREILSQIPSLSPALVEPQTPFPDDYKDSTRLIDFTIEEGDLVRIALEVDGWSKEPGKRGTDAAGFVDWSVRELYMTRAGWVPLRFANWLVENEPEMLRETIALQLTLRRNIAAMVKAGGERADRAEAEKRELEIAAQAAIDGEEAAKAKLDKLQLKIESEYLSAVESERLHELQDEVETLNRELLEIKREKNRMKVLSLAFAGVVVVAIVAVVVVLISGGGETDSDPGASPQPFIDSEILVRCDTATPVDELTDADEGEIVTARGEVAGTKRFEGDAARTVLNLGAVDFPDQDLIVLIWNENVKNWTTAPDVKYNDREVAVAGRLEIYKGDLQVEADSPNDVAICS